jgi:hypothetical protein
VGVGGGDEALETVAPSFGALGTDYPPGREAAIAGRLSLEEIPGGGIAAELALVPDG